MTIYKPNQNIRNGVPQRMRKFVIFSWLYLLSIPLFAQDIKVAQLDCEYRNNPIGIDVLSPSLSWKLQSSKHNVMQKAYQI
jgi:alpha-L-rhamnosidase